MSWSEAPLYLETHGLAVWISEHAASWEAPTRRLGTRLIDAGCELLESVALALTFPATRPAQLERADACVVRLRVLLRVARDLRALSSRALRYAASRLRAVGRMLGGWRKRWPARGAADDKTPTHIGAGSTAVTA